MTGTAEAASILPVLVQRDRTIGSLRMPGKTDGKVPIFVNPQRSVEKTDLIQDAPLHQLIGGLSAELCGYLFKTIGLMPVLTPVTQNPHASSLVVDVVDLRVNPPGLGMGFVGFKLQFKLSGEGGGSWYATIKNGTCTVTEGQSEAPQATIMMSAKDYVLLATGKLGGTRAFLTGRVKTSGDFTLLQKMPAWFPQK